VGGLSGWSSAASGWLGVRGEHQDVGVGCGHGRRLAGVGGVVGVGWVEVVVVQLPAHGDDVLQVAQARAGRGGDDTRRLLRPNCQAD